MTTLAWCLLAIYLFAAAAIFATAVHDGRPIARSLGPAILWPLVILAAVLLLALFRLGFLADLRRKLDW